ADTYSPKSDCQSVLTGDFWVSGKDTFIYLTMGIISTPLAGAPYFGVASLNLLRATWHMLVPEQLELFF
ncbi:hypothetical protein, partial [Shewanella algae]